MPCRRLIDNDVDDDETMFAVCDRYWLSAAGWAKTRGIDLESETHAL